MSSQYIIRSISIGQEKNEYHGKPRGSVGRKAIGSETAASCKKFRGCFSFIGFHWGIAIEKMGYSQNVLMECENGYIESLNARMRVEFFNGETFDTMFEAQVLT